MPSRADQLAGDNQAEYLGIICRYYGGGWTPTRHDFIQIRDNSGMVVRTVRAGYSLAWTAMQCQRWLEEEAPSWPS